MTFISICAMTVILKSTCKQINLIHVNKCDTSFIFFISLSIYVNVGYFHKSDWDSPKPNRNALSEIPFDFMIINLFIESNQAYLDLLHVASILTALA